MMWRGRTGDFRPAAESWIVLYNGGRGRPEPPGMAGCGLGMGWERQGLLPRTRAHLASGRRVQRVDVVRLAASLWGRRRLEQSGGPLIAGNRPRRQTTTPQRKTMLHLATHGK